MTIVENKKVSKTGLWDDWRWQVSNRITNLEGLEKWIDISSEEKKAIHYSSGRFCHLKNLRLLKVQALELLIKSIPLLQKQMIQIMTRSPIILTGEMEVLVAG